MVEKKKKLPPSIGEFTKLQKLHAALGERYESLALERNALQTELHKLTEELAKTQKALAVAGPIPVAKPSTGAAVENPKRRGLEL